MELVRKYAAIRWSETWSVKLTRTYAVMRWYEVLCVVKLVWNIVCWTL